MLDQHLQGAADDRHLAVCQAEGRILVTLDRGFADILAYPPDRYPGLIVLRPRRQDERHVNALVHRLLPLLTTEPIHHRLWIVEESQVRIRTRDPER